LPYQLLTVPLLLLAAWVTGAAVRVHYADSLLGMRNELELRYAVGDALLRLNPDQYNLDRPTMQSVRALAKLIPARKELESFGSIRVPTVAGSESLRPLGINEPVPSYAVLVIENPVLAQQKAREAIPHWIDVLCTADAVYPHNPDVAAHLFHWYDLLLRTTQDPREKQRLVLDCLRWAKTGVERSPAQAWYHLNYGKALWYRGNIEGGAKAWSYHKEGLEEYRQATLLYPTSPLMWSQYGTALIEFGKARKKMGDAVSGDAQIAEGEKALAYAQEVAREYPGHANDVALVYSTTPAPYQ
jgi:tetratricopeptide (TPR) repeat protein